MVRSIDEFYALATDPDGLDFITWDSNGRVIIRSVRKLFETSMFRNYRGYNHMLAYFRCYNFHVEANYKYDVATLYHRNFNRDHPENVRHLTYTKADINPLVVIDDAVAARMQNSPQISDPISEFPNAHNPTHGRWGRHIGVIRTVIRGHRQSYIRSLLERAEEMCARLDAGH